MSGPSTLHFGIVGSGFAHQEGRGFSVQGIGGVGVAQELRQEYFKDVDQICVCVGGRVCFIRG